VPLRHTGLEPDFGSPLGSSDARVASSAGEPGSADFVSQGLRICCDCSSHRWAELPIPPPEAGSAVGERIDEEIRRDIAENRKPDKPAKQIIIGIDGAFVKGRRPTDRANLEIITGRIEADTEPSKVFAVVRDQDGRAKQDVQALIRQRGRGLETKVRVVSDGEDGMRSMVGEWFVQR
jgi:hypothetical protein